MGWKIKKIEDYQSANWKIYNLNRDDVSAELRFWFEPKDELKWCRLTVYFLLMNKNFVYQKV